MWASPRWLKHLLKIALLLSAVLWIVPTAAFAQNIDTWTCKDVLLGGPNWNDAMNWDNGVPTATSDVLIPNSTSTCVANLNGTGNVHNLGILAGGEVIIQDGGYLTINGDTINNNGQLLIDGKITQTTLGIKGSVTLSGSGRVVMSGYANNFIAGGTLTNQSSIEGGGTILVFMNNNNSGTINANTGVTLDVSVSGNNAGIFESTGNGTLSLMGYFNNTGGTIGGNNVNLPAATITGGTLSAGQINSNGSTILNGVTLAQGCQYLVEPGAKTTLEGTITNQGTIRLQGDAAPNNASLTVTGTVTLAGTGQVVVSGKDDQITGTGTIVNQQTIQGIGFINSGLNNQGTINANSTTEALTVDCPTTGPCTSSGNLIGTEGGQIDVGCISTSGCTLTATGGTLENAKVLNSVTIFGGSVNNVEVQQGEFNGVTINGPVDVYPGENLILTGPNTLNSSINITPQSCSTCQDGTMTVSGTATLTGPGSVNLNSNSGFIANITGSGTLINGSIIAGGGTIDSITLVNSPTGTVEAISSSVPLTLNTKSVSNHGTFLVAANSGSSPSVFTITGPFNNYNPSTGTVTGGKYIVDGTFQFNNANVIHNAGNFILAGQIQNLTNGNGLANFSDNAATGTLTIAPQTFTANFTTPGTFKNAGKLSVLMGVSLVIGGSGTNYNQTGGVTTVDGTLAVPLGGLIDFTGGTVQGAGTFSGNLSVGNASGGTATFVIGDTATKAAVIHALNNYSQLATGVLDVQIGGSTLGKYSQLNATGTANISGVLNIHRINKFVPKIGQIYTLLNASSGLTGTFSQVNGLSINTTEHFGLSYTGNLVTLTVLPGQ